MKYENMALNMRMFRVAYLGITMNLSKSNQSNGINRLSKSNSKLNLRHQVVKIILKSLFIELILPQFHTLNLNRDRPVRWTHQKYIIYCIYRAPHSAHENAKVEPHCQLYRFRSTSRPVK